MAQGCQGPLWILKGPKLDRKQSIEGLRIAEYQMLEADLVFLNPLRMNEMGDVGSKCMLKHDDVETETSAASRLTQLEIIVQVMAVQV